MSLRRTLGFVLVAAVLVAGAAGCARESASTPDGPTADNGEVADSGGRLTADSLPTETGYAWDIVRYEGTEPFPAQLTVAGPWTLMAGADWPVSTTQIVPAEEVPGIDGFDGFDYVEKSVDAGGDHYFPRAATDEWLLQLGSITVLDGAVTAQPYAEPMKVWPLGFDVGDSFVVLDGQNFRIEATVLAQNTATVPAGEIENAYLVRFEFIPITEGAISGTQYYLLAPDVGFVAIFGPSAGDEETGFTALQSARVLASLPEKR